MNTKTFLSLASLCLPIFLISSCTRPEGDATRVSFQLPKANVGLAKMSSSVKAQGSDDHWGLADPSSISEIGCWAVFVGGSEADAGDKRCSVGQGSNFQVIRFVQYHGLYPEGALIEFDTKVGVRNFYLLGMKKGSLACESFHITPDLTSANYSQPLLLGRATKDLRSSVESVTINAALNLSDLNSQRIGHCSFMSGRDVGGLRIAGPAQGSGSSYQLNQAVGVCGKYKLELTQAGSDGGGVVNEEDRKFTFSRAALSAPWATTEPLEVYTSPDCATTSLVTNTNPLMILRGEESTEFYVKGQSPGSIDATAALTLTPVVATGTTSAIPPLTLAVRIKSGISGTIKFGFFNSSLSVGPGFCKEVEYYATKTFSGVSYYAEASSSVYLKKLDHSASLALPGTDARGLKTNCSTALGDDQLSLPTAAFGSFALDNPATWNIKDVAIVDVQGVDLDVNVQKRAEKLQWSLPGTEIFASDCVPLTLTPVDAAGAAVSLSGTDDSGTGTGQRIKAFASAQTISGTTHVAPALDSACSTPVYGRVSITNGANPLSLYLRPGLADQGLRLRAHGNPYVNSDSSSSPLDPVINPKWDPGLWAGSLVAWARPAVLPAHASPSTATPGFVQDNSGYLWGWASTNYPASLEHFSYISPASLYASVVDSSSMPKALKFGTGLLSNVKMTPSGLNNDFSITLLVRRSATAYAGAHYLQVYTSGTRYFSISEDQNGGATPRLYFESGEAPSACGSKTNQTAIPLLGAGSTTTSTLDEKWTVLTLSRSGSALSIWVNNQKVVDADTTTWAAGSGQASALGSIYIGSGGNVECSQPAFPGLVAEAVVTSTALTNADHTKLYQYLKDRHDLP